MTPPAETARPITDMTSPVDSTATSTPALRNQNIFERFVQLLIWACILLGFSIHRLSQKVAALARKGYAKVGRILTYLQHTEDHEAELRYLDDIRLAWQIVLNAFRGVDDVYRHCFIRMFGTRPERAIPEIQAKTEALTRWADQPPKKPAASVRPAPAAARRSQS